MSATNLRMMFYETRDDQFDYDLIDSLIALLFTTPFDCLSRSEKISARPFYLGSVAVAAIRETGQMKISAII